MRAFSEKGVIIELDRIPMVKIGRAASNSSRKVTQTADKNLSRLATRKRSASNTQIDPGCVGIDRFQALIIVYRFVVAANAERIREAWREDVGFLHRNELPRSQCVELNVIQPVGSRVGCPVEHVRAEQTILCRKSVVDTAGKKVFVDHLLSGEGELSKVAVRVLGQRHRVEGEISRRVRIYCHVPADKNPLARVRRRHGRNRRDAQRLPDSFVVGKEECSILQDWSADRSSKLVALEGRNTTHIEEVPGVEFAITKKLVHAAGCSIGVVIEADAIQTVVVLLWPGAGDGQLLSKTAISAIGARRKVGLGVNR